MVETLINLDFILFKLFNTPWPGGDQIMWAVSSLWWWTPLYLLLLWELWKKSDRTWDRTLVRVSSRPLHHGNRCHFRAHHQARYPAFPSIAFHRIAR